jgi:hypothetical protein
MASGDINRSLDASAPPGRTDDPPIPRGLTAASTEVGAISPVLGQLHGLTFDASGNLYVASQGG